MARRAFVDTHIHFWDLKDTNLHYSWLQPDWVHPILGNIDNLKVLRYMADEFIGETRFQNVPKIVHVQAALGIADPVEETRWLQAQADATCYPHGIVGHCDLVEPDAAEQLDRHLEYANFRGVRDFAAGTNLDNPDWLRGLRAMVDRNLVFCIDTVWEQMGEVARVADETGVVMCMDHAGFPRERTDEYLANWRRGMAEAAKSENVIVKISGLGMCDTRWTVDSIRPYVLGCIEAFGVDRCVMGTNWPVDRIYSSYGDVLDAYAEIIADFSDDEQTKLFSANAERIFRV
ncbi:MAG: amidohydrolase family protein [Actinobacteria bacterium]|nr:amidohydrolase family protein [Actinomycetota bacterium]